MAIDRAARAFDRHEFVGWVAWNREATAFLGTRFLEHGCHIDDFRTAYTTNTLTPRSTISFVGDAHPDRIGTWVTANTYSQANYFGPLIVQIPIRFLESKRFAVFHRYGGNPTRICVEWQDAFEPIEDYDRPWKEVGVDIAFPDPQGIWPINNFVLTTKLPLNEGFFRPREHTNCVSGQCSGLGYGRSRDMLQAFLNDAWSATPSKDERRRVRFRFLDLDLLSPFNEEPLVVPGHLPSQQMVAWNPLSYGVAERLKEFLYSTGQFTICSHIGSTAIPGCDGSAVVDVVATCDMRQLESALEILARVGFQIDRDTGVAQATVNYSGTDFSTRILVRDEDGQERQAMEMLRDRLIRDNALVRDYSALKQQLLTGKSDAEAQRVAKAEFIGRVMGKQ